MVILNAFAGRKPEGIIPQAATVSALPYRFADRDFAFNASVSRFRGGALLTSD